MSDTATQLHASANAQIHELIGLLSARGEDGLRLPCPGREKLGDGTVGALASHTADNYHRIAGFARSAGERTPAPASRHRIQRFLLARGHSPGRHDEGTHDAGYTATDVDLDGLLQRLSSAAEALTPLTAISDQQLATVPPAGAFRFCDGQRTLAQVLTSLLNHQSRQIDALRAALA